MPGSGKSTVGRLLAAELSLVFFDLDAEIISSQGKSIAEIFSEGGEELFRKIESETLINTINKETPFVMAAGGGTPCFLDGMQKMNDAGTTIYLDTPIDLLLSRTKKKQHRPLLGENHAEKLKELLKTRKDCYSKANYELQTKNLELAGKIEGILKILAD
ncbi:MAG: shikimate kinase [Bacteroidetes bacterium]|nr:MAG: shikimate kinase [Bacteroidota bacterium]